ncbi:hypothetical protein EX30DRAFT_342476 [Ascodesmis nigricans]|uniref:Uncharacterized protein n=1 Tax=Ascodesmis nigricans TaxID=341454 RepID=A0A4S2MS90_9PEZI|nr:hypothetical protein EX30DRAFT_342476 [Ascodesmis nigricans]
MMAWGGLGSGTLGLSGIMVRPHTSCPSARAPPAASTGSSKTPNTPSTAHTSTHAFPKVVRSRAGAAGDEGNCGS